jgi:AcrR family transcriptional regulator
VGKTDLRERLLRAATEQIRERGAKTFSLRQTAREAGVDPAMVYREFADRAELLEAVALEAFVRLAEDVRQATAGVSEPGARLRAMGRSYVSFALAHPTEFEIMFAGGKRLTLPSPIPSAYTQLEELLSEIERTGRLRRSPEEAALVCWSTVHGVAWLLVAGALAGYPTSDPDVVVQTVMDHLVSSLIS